MCGIVGMLLAPGKSVPPEVLDDMVEVLERRGPDARGTFVDAAAGVYLGHRRLAILDLSPGGAQPMTSDSGRYVVILNGEIYNYRNLRKELDPTSKHTWKGTSDTEVLLDALERWGYEKTLSKLEGMYAFALWDREAEELLLARDRFGEKPLYVARHQYGILFGSQLGCMLKVPSFAPVENERAIDLLLMLSYIPEPITIFENVTKLPAGTYARLAPGDTEFTPIPYWDAADAAIEAQAASSDSFDLIERIERRLETVVSNQIISDVPVGAFLSGGIDSSLIVALMQKVSASPVRTFTIGFEEAHYNEAAHAQKIAHHLGTDHTEAILHWSDALDLIEDLPAIYDEPFADSSQIPTYLVSRIARKSVSVCLSGDGGDEVFGGYNRHRLAKQYERWRALVPPKLRAPVGRVLGAVTSPRFERPLSQLLRLLGQASLSLPSEQLGKAGRALRENDDSAMYVSLIRRDNGLLNGTPLRDLIAHLEAKLAASGLSLAERFMLLDTVMYLPGDILTKVDRAAMAVSLETRVPYLDHTLFSLVWQLKIGDRLSSAGSKAILRKALARYVPPSLFERPKAGFGVPIEFWLRGSLRDWMNDRLSAFKIAYPRHAATIDRAKREFMEGLGHHQHFLWSVVMLQIWRERYTAHRSAA